VSTQLCDTCKADDAAWRDSAPVRGGIAIHTMVRTVRDVAEHRRMRSEEHYERVRFQRELIARQCSAQHQGRS
jgi:hypothetical protein